MASVELRPGDTLNIVWTSVQDTPLGVKEVESSFAFSYEDLLLRLKTKGRMGKSRRSGTDGARFSRVVALSTNALRKGKWSTGAEIERTEVFVKLMHRFNNLIPSEYSNITDNAKNSLLDLYRSEGILKKNQKTELKGAIEAIGILVSE
ncbi:MAG: hypothetical protein HYW48_07445 [Deltaproteobacteria bacterium]|nr:hypothetical protein [Deltaproteobacteria bacterium]